MSGLIDDIMARAADSPAIIAADQTISHRTLAGRALAIMQWLADEQLPPGSVVSFDGDYSAESVALLLALLQHRAIVVPLSSDSRAHFEAFRELAETEYVIESQSGQRVLRRTGIDAGHEHYRELRRRAASGLVLFSSGSTGTPKAIVQDMSRLLAKFEKPGKSQTGS